jgi:hypothetical protein
VDDDVAVLEEEDVVLDDEELDKVCFFVFDVATK